jgi:hypothetical protein
MCTCRYPAVQPIFGALLSDLIAAMLAADPDARPNMQQVRVSMSVSMSVSVSVSVSVSCLCLCLCMQNERERASERAMRRERESVCVCVCLSVCVYVWCVRVYVSLRVCMYGLDIFPIFFIFPRILPVRISPSAIFLFTHARAIQVQPHL